LFERKCGADVLIPNFLGAELSFSTVPNCLFQRVPICLGAELSCFPTVYRIEIIWLKEELIMLEIVQFDCLLKEELITQSMFSLQKILF
jgi:hypothetical protein